MSGAEPWPVVAFPGLTRQEGPALRTSYRAPVYISRTRTHVQWLAIRDELQADRANNLWRNAVQDFFHDRLVSRYLEPIECLNDQGSCSGEGFSIATIQCALIEFLESTVQGLTYRYIRGGDTLGTNEYSKSKALFVNFLVRRDPFASVFDVSLAEDFYTSIRCPLLHEARTKNGWTILAEAYDNSIIDRARKVLYRNGFQRSLIEFIENYEAQLLHDSALQDAFIRKFDNLATP